MNTGLAIEIRCTSPDTKVTLCRRRHTHVTGSISVSRSSDVFCYCYNSEILFIPMVLYDVATSHVTRQSTLARRSSQWGFSF
jgi:hypothetical protein